MTNCQNCGSKCIEVLDLGSQPICNRFLESESEFKDEMKYPLGLVFCPKCSLTQISKSLATDLVFADNFNYLSSSSKDVVKYFTETANRLTKRYGLTSDDYVLDIGSNDGVLLLPLKEKGINVIGVDPAPLPAKVANDKEIYTIVGQFEDVVNEIKYNTKGKLRLITAYNVMAHTSTIHEFLEKVKELMEANPNAVFVSGSHYLPNLIEGGEWDLIYHEHQRFYTVSSIQELFARHNLYVYDCEKNDTQGGSMEVHAVLSKKLITDGIYAILPAKPRTERCKRIIASEGRFRKVATYKQFRKKVNDSKKKLVKLLASLKKQNKHIMGIGAPMKSSTLLNYCGIGTQYLDGLTEVNELKIGRYSAGMHLKVIDERTWDFSKTDYAFILSWNMADTIMKKLKEKGYKGKFIIPLPKLVIRD